MKLSLYKYVLGLVLVSAATTITIGQSIEDYKVYDAVVQHMFRDGITRFDMNAKIEMIVIREQTVSGKDNWEQLKNRIPALTDETIAGYETARKSEQKLQAKLDIPFKYQLITEAQLDEIFPKKKEYDRLGEYWNNFRRLYPNSAGYNSFSRVGYSKSGREALVYFVNWCGELCGTGTYLLVVKGDKGWKVKGGGQMWIS